MKIVYKYRIKRSKSDWKYSETNGKMKIKEINGKISQIKS